MFIRFIQSVPAFRMLIAYISGLVFLSGNDRIVCSLLLFAVWIYFAYVFLEKRLATTWNIRWMPCIGFVCFWTAFGSFSGKMAWEKSDYPANSDNSFIAIAELEAEPTIKKRSYQLQVRIDKATEKQWEGKNLVLYLQKDKKVESLNYGDQIQVDLHPQKLQAKVDTASFDYARWLRIKGFCATAYVKTDSWKFVSAPSGWNFKATASRIGSELVSMFRKSGLSGNRLALASAMSIGYRDELDKSVESHFRSAGITHILSVSGLHVAVIYSLFQGLLFFLRFTERQIKFRQLLIILFLWVYAFITGLSPSVNRSALMFSLISMGKCLEKPSQTLNTVVFSAFILLLWNPLYLFDVGFQLSYCAVLGIVVVYPKARDLWEPHGKLLKYVRDLLMISIVAQLATVPLTVFYFGQFPNYFLLGNLVAVPLSSLLIFLSAGCLVFFYVPFVNSVIFWCLDSCASLFLFYAETMGSLPFAVTDGLELNVPQVIVLYFLMFSFFCWYFLKQKNFIFGILACIFCYQVLVLDHRLNKQFVIESCEMAANQYICKKYSNAYQDY